MPSLYCFHLKLWLHLYGKAYNAVVKLGGKPKTRFHLHEKCSHLLPCASAHNWKHMKLLYWGGENNKLYKSFHTHISFLLWNASWLCKWSMWLVGLSLWERALLEHAKDPSHLASCFPQWPNRFLLEAHKQGMRSIAFLHSPATHIHSRAPLKI